MGVKAGDGVAGRVPGGTGHGWGTRGVGDGAGLWEKEERDHRVLVPMSCYLGLAARWTSDLRWPMHPILSWLPRLVLLRRTAPSTAETVLRCCKGDFFHSSIKLRLWEQAAVLEGLAGCCRPWASIAAEEETGFAGLLTGFQPVAPRRTQCSG